MCATKRPGEREKKPAPADGDGEKGDSDGDGPDQINPKSVPIPHAGSRQWLLLRVLFDAKMYREDYDDEDSELDSSKIIHIVAISDIVQRSRLVQRLIPHLRCYWRRRCLHMARRERRMAAYVVAQFQLSCFGGCLCCLARMRSKLPHTRIELGSFRAVCVVRYVV